jgi:tetratricopeptide (TPR) repeat protein
MRRSACGWRTSTFSRNEWKRAEGELRKAIALAPDDFEYVGVLSAVLQHDGREREGEQAQTAWVDKHPDAVESFRVRAQALVSSESPQAAQVVDAGLARYPDDSALHIARAEVLRGGGDIAGAAKEYSKAAQLAPKWAFAQGVAARFFLKVANDDERALSYYLDTYFLDPQYYDGEFAESRIRTLVHERARARRGTNTIAARLADADSAVVGLAMEEAEQNWSDDFVRPLIVLLHRLDPDVRYSAADLLRRHARGRSGDEVVKVLSDDDLLARSAAAYAVGPLAGERFVPVMVWWLSDPAELLQYDAISVLIASGGNAGRAALQKLQKERTVKHPLLRKMIEKGLAAGDGG